MRVERFHRLALAAVLAIALLGARTGVAGAAPASSADSFVDSIGVNVHLGYASTPYTENRALLQQRLVELGVRHVRDNLMASNPGEYAALRALGAVGIHSTLILGAPSEGNAALEARIATLKSQLLGSVEAVEGPNEYSTMHGGVNWPEELRNFQKLLWEKVKGDPQLAALPVLGPALVHNDQHLLGDVSAYLDYGNIHSYPEGEGPENGIEPQLKRAKENSGPTKPLIATETGYTNATKCNPPNKGENRPVPESVAGTYVPRLFLEYWNRGLVRTFSYELIDEQSEPAELEREDHFGLLRHDFAPKPAFTALHNLIAILSDPGPAFAPGSLEYAASGGSFLHASLLQKRDGRFFVALWRDERVWNPETKTAVPAPIEPATVTLPEAVSSYSVYEPTASTTPVASGGPSAAITVQVGPGVTLLELGAPVVANTPETPPSTPPTPPSTPPSPTSSSPSTTPPIAPPTTQPSAPPEECVVPQLKGRKLGAAKQAALRANCRIGKVVDRDTAERMDGRVISQSPARGRTLDADSPIRVVVGD